MLMIQTGGELSEGWAPPPPAYPFSRASAMFPTEPAVTSATSPTTTALSTESAITKSAIAKSAFLDPERMKLIAQLAPVAVAPPQPMRGWPWILGGGVLAFYFLFVRKRKR